MKKLKSIIMVLVILIMVFVSACSKTNNDNNETSDKTFAGIAIYQNSSSNKNYSKIQSNANYINKIISTEDDKILYEEDPEFLFYIYEPNGITDGINKDNFISNTTNLISLEDNILNITMERIFEDTDILIFSIYKNNKGKYSLELIGEEKNITQAIQSFEFDFIHNKFDKIKLTLKTNMSVNEKY